MGGRASQPQPNRTPTCQPGRLTARTQTDLATRRPIEAKSGGPNSPRKPPPTNHFFRGLLDGCIVTSDDVAQALRKATATLIADACRSLPRALTDEQRLDQSLDSLEEAFEIILLRTLFGRLGRDNGSGRVTIDATEHFRPLLDSALTIARNSTAEEIRRASSGQQRRQATRRAIELQILARQLAIVERSREEGSMSRGR